MIEQIASLQSKVAELEKKLAKNNWQLEIEAALERVRARAMGMHNSNELSVVLSVLFEQFDISYRTTGRNGQRVQAEQKIDMDAVDAWKESVKTGLSVIYN